MFIRRCNILLILIIIGWIALIIDVSLVSAKIIINVNKVSCKDKAYIFLDKNSTMTIEEHLESGRHLLSFEAVAKHTGNDSLFIEYNSNKTLHWLSIIGYSKQNKIISIREPSDIKIKITARENGGFKIRDIQFKKINIDIPINIKESLKSLKTNKLFHKRTITENTKKLACAYSTRFYSRYDIGRFNELYDSDQRMIGNEILKLTILAWIDKDPIITQALKKWCEEAMKIDRWGNNKDLEISHLLFALAIVYDWHKDHFDNTFRRQLKQFIYNHAKYQYEYAVEHETQWWPVSYWSNHCWINYTSILASGMALSDDYEEALEWVVFAKEKMEKVIDLQSSDGSNHEGLNYSVYGNIWLVRALTLLQVFDENIFQRSEYLRNYYNFFKAFSVNNKLTTFFDVGDSPQYLWYNPCEIFLKLYQEYNLEVYNELYLYYLMKYKDKRPDLFTTVYGMPKKRKTNYTITSKSPYYSEDIGIFIDKYFEKNRVKESFLFKSGVPGGKTAHTLSNQNPAYHLNRGHTHPDQNHFLIWNKYGFLISDTGYTNKKLTINHNSLVINEKGQLGEGTKWLKSPDYNNKKFSKDAGFSKKATYKSNDITIVSADASEFYPDKLGLEQFIRTIIWIKTFGFIVFDEIKTQKPEQLKLSFHSDFKIEKNRQKEFDFKQGLLKKGKFLSLYPIETNTTISKHNYVSHPKGIIRSKGNLLSIEKNMKGNQQDFVSVILPGSKNRKVSFKEEGRSYQIQVRNNSKLYSVLLKKQKSKEIIYDNYTIDAKLAIVTSDNSGKCQEIVLFKGRSISSRGKQIWSAKEEQNKVFLFDKSGRISPES